MLKSTAHGPITRIQLAPTLFGRPLYTVSAYLVDGLLIDSGSPHTAPELVAWLRSQTVHQVVNTHHHEDHSGGDGLLLKSLGIPLAAPRETVRILAAFPRLELYRRLVWGQPKNVVARPLDVTIETDNHQFRVLHTPGHCPDHACFFEPEQGWLFGGDLYIHERAHYLRRDENLGDLMESLRRVRARQPQLLFCSHAGLVQDAAQAIDRKLAYWESLRAHAWELRQSGRSPREITDRLLGREGMMTRVSRGHISKINLIHALLDLEPRS